jgi:lipase
LSPSDTVFQRTFGHGPHPALAIHCGLAHSGAWRGIADALDDLLRVTAFDLPGHGRSPDWKSDDTRDVQAVATGWARDVLDHHPAHIIGHSFGASVALRLAVENPELVKTLTLIEPVYFAAVRGTAIGDQHRSENIPFQEALTKGDRVRAARVFTEIWGDGTPWDALSDRIRNEFTARIDLIEAQAHGLNNDPAGALEPGVLERIVVPVLLVEGANSPPIMPAILDVLQARLPNCQRVCVPMAAHMVAISHPGEVATAMRSMIART